MKRAIFAAVLVAFGSIAQADTPVVVAVKTVKTGMSWRFDVTLRHADTGWNHYADGWGVYLENGTELGYRFLAHPHVNEQPFIRSLGSVKIPAGTGWVKIVPHDLVHGDGKAFLVELK